MPIKAIKPLKNACIWVTGASSGIGEALVRQLIAEGNFVIASARNKEALHQLARELGSKLKPFVFDVSDADGVVKSKRELAEISDYLDCVIACAGVCEYEDDLSFNPDRYERVFQTNFLGVVRTLHIAKPFLERSEQRSYFVAVGSLSSLLPFTRAEAYGASKAALEYFIKSASIDLCHSDIDIRLVRPGFIKTPLIKSNDFSMPFLMSPEQAATRILAGIKNRKVIIDFPRRLSWPLRFLGLFEGFLRRFIGPKLTRMQP